ncbi:MAG: nucleotidyltransferase domain-containing protein [Longimicrobiaceae bacterium]
MARLLLYFVTHPDDAVHVRELRRLTGLGMGSLQAELKRLVRLELLSTKREANRVMYRLEFGHPRWRAFREVLATTAEPVELLRAAFAGVEGVEAAFIFGSEARGDTRDDSDIDLFIIGRDDVHHAVSQALTEIELLLRREIDVILYTPERVQARAARPTEFVRRVMREPKLWVAGESAALEPLQEQVCSKIT